MPTLIMYDGYTALNNLWECSVCRVLVVFEFHGDGDTMISDNATLSDYSVADAAELSLLCTW